MDSRIEKTLAQLEKNRITGHFVETPEALHRLIASLVPEGATVSVGGSMTLFETGTIDFLRNGTYEFWDRYAEGLTPEDSKALYRKSFSADAYFSSVNAITEDGWLYNIDGLGNRVASIIYGPDKVFLIAGTNKIVKDMEAAEIRLRHKAAPANAVRLNRNTPCAKTGVCMDCKHKDRICSAYVKIGWQFDPNRIHVILINGNFGY
jgi:L-lactate utilization protein LutB